MTRRAPLALAAGAALTLAIWAFFPIVLLAVHASDAHATWTGADGLIGADGVLGADQLQYLAWARSVAGHGLASDLFTLSRAGHVYLEPVSGVIGGLLALGVPLIAGSLAAKAVAAVALAFAAVLWARRFEPGRPVAAVATVALALFTVTPATALVNWLQTGSAPFRFNVYLAGDEMLAASKLWGYAPAALAVALVAVALLALERTLRDGRRSARWRAVAAGAALLTGWLHPWQGITLALIVVGLAMLRRRRSEWPALATVFAFALVPVAYYAVLAHTDPAWQVAAHNEAGARLPAGVFALCLGPLAAIAAIGVRRPGDEPAEQALLLWAPAALITYFVNDAFATHALEGLSFPFAVLAVRGAGRLRLPTLLGAACVVLLTVPGLAYDARKFVRTASSGLVQYALPRSDVAALRFIHSEAPAGGVLAPTPFAAVVPSRTGRAVWVGHGDWSPDYSRRARQADRLFSGGLAPAAARRLVRGTGARLLVSDCDHRFNVGRELSPLVSAMRRFGCARVYVVRAPAIPPAPARRRRR